MGARLPRQAEIHHFEGLACHDHEVAGLDVPMNNPGLVCILQRQESLRGKLCDLIERQEVAASAEVIQESAFRVFHGDVEDAPILEHVEDGHDVGVEELPCGASLSEEPGPTLFDFLRTGALRGPDGLERHPPSDLGVVGQIHHTHGAPTHHLLDLIAANLDGIIHQEKPPEAIGPGNGNTYP